ncbi:MAG: calcium-binding protein [Sphingomonadales bacterium]|nr:calcium-binding protein [Sphingomonadales bacterium]
MPDLNGAVLRVEYLSHFSTADALALASTSPISLSGAIVRYNGQTIGTISGGANGSDLQIILNSAASPAMVEALLDNIYFRNQSEAPFTTARLLAAELTLINGSQYDVTASLTVIDVDDAASAVDDMATVTESSFVTIDVLANEADVDQRLDQVAMIDGTAVLFGDTVTLASGARVTLQTDGQLLYDPNGAFNALTDALNGYGFHSATDNFSYSLSGGSAATVTVTINGETSADDILLGDANANDLKPALQWQTLLGLAGTDSLDDNGLVADLRGGTDNDVYFVSNLATLVSEDAGEGTDSVNSALASFTLPPNVENLYFTVKDARLYGYGNAQNNVIEGGALGDFLIGYQGNDILRGGAGADVLNGGVDHDILDGGTGNDVMVGGGGNDIFYVDSASDVVIEGADPGYDTVFTSLQNYTLAAWVENLSFSGTASYTGTGNAVGNQMQGSINGDTLLGLGGNDRLIGFGGNDLLDGGEGNDLLQGGIGSDQLTGGVGADQFRFDTALSASNVDTISDFEFGVDQVQLALAVFSALDLGSLPTSAYFEELQRKMEVTGSFMMPRPVPFITTLTAMVVWRKYCSRHWRHIPCLVPTVLS